jgi:hypothetical protein
MKKIKTAINNKINKTSPIIRTKKITVNFKVLNNRILAMDLEKSWTKSILTN